MAASVASALGAVAAVAFAIAWFPHASRGCGVVRFYEQAFGVIALGAWLAGTGVGLSVAFVWRRAPTAVAAGSAIAILASLIMASVCVKTIRDLREADYSLKKTPRLLALLTGPNPDARNEAARALGERKATEAVAPLCAILDAAGEDINLRLNAAMALGRICASPRTQDIELAPVIASLTKVLKSQGDFLAAIAAEALGRIGDRRAVQAVAELVNDDTHTLNARREALTALSRIPGPNARAALEKARGAEGPPELVDAARRCLAAPRTR